MASRSDRRAKLKARMQNDAANRDKGSGRKPLLDLSNYDDVNWFKAKKRKNAIDILPFEVTTDNDPMGAAIGEDQYKLEFWKHNNIGPKDAMVLCLQETFNKPCPICEQRKAMLDAGADWKDDVVKALSAKRRCMYNVIDVNDPGKGVQLFEQSHFKFEKELFGAAEYKNPDFICFADIEEGYTVTFRGSEETFNRNKFIEPKDFSFEEREPYEETIYNEVYPLDAMLLIPTYDEVQAMFLGVDEDEDEKEEPKKETKTRKKKIEPKEEERPAGRRRKQSEPESKKEKPEEDLTGCPHALEFGLIKGSDWDNHDVCKDCEEEIYNECGAIYDDLEKMKKEREVAEKAEENKPTTRRRSRRGDN